MSAAGLALVVVTSTAIVVAVALLGGGVLVRWAMVAAVLAYRGVFPPKDAESAPPTPSWARSSAEARTS